MEVKTCVSNGVLIGVNQESQSPEKLVFVSILPKRRHVSVFFILKIENPLNYKLGGKVLLRIETEEEKEAISPSR